MRIGPLNYIAARLGFAVVLALAMMAIPARAAAPAAPVFPVGSRVGLLPPPGMTLSKTFPGFVDVNKNAGIVINTLPAAAFADMQKTLTDDVLKKRGVTVNKRETLQLGIGTGDFVVGTQTAPDNKTSYRKWFLLVQAVDLTVAITVQAPEGDPAYSEPIMRAALSTLALRTTVPEEEFLSLLPFKIGDLAGFHVANVMPGRALLLIDAPNEPHLVVTQGLPEYEFDARFIVTGGPGGPTDPDQRANFARTAFNTIGGIKDLHLTMAEPIRINSQEGFETVASAKDAATDANLMVVQWLRFGNDAFLQMIGISRADIWDRELPRMRAMRDSIAFK
jgi:hypothetical protein